MQSSRWLQDIYLLYVLQWISLRRWRTTKPGQAEREADWLLAWRRIGQRLPDYHEPNLRLLPLVPKRSDSQQLSDSVIGTSCSTDLLQSRLARTEMLRCLLQADCSYYLLHFFLVFGLGWLISVNSPTPLSRLLGCSQFSVNWWSRRSVWVSWSCVCLEQFPWQSFRK